MVMKIWLCAFALVSLASSIPVDHVPNQCPAEDGSYPVFYGHPDDCQYYFMCNHGIPLLMKCTADLVWSDQYRTCVGANTNFDTCTLDRALSQCSTGGVSLIPHPAYCQRYFNCSKTEPPPMRSYLKQYEEECPYPQAFDATTLSCRPYNEVDCGLYRWLGKSPCDYVKNLCGGAHCEPCSSRMPSCVGLTDGRHEHPYRQWSPFYIICEDERNVGPGHYFCERHDLTDTIARFSPVKKECVSNWEVPRDQGGLAPSCDGKTSGLSYKTDERPDVYYSCPDAQVSYCGVGNVFNENSQQCESSA